MRHLAWDANSSDAEGDNLIDTYPDERSNSAQTDLEAAEEWNLVEKKLNGLDDREVTVIKMRFGLAGEAPQTLKEIGERITPKLTPRTCAADSEWGFGEADGSRGKIRKIVAPARQKPRTIAEEQLERGNLLEPQQFETDDLP